MFSDRIFQVTLLISCITHGVILFQNPNFVVFSPRKIEQKIEVSYLKPVQENKAQPAQPVRTLNKEPFLKASAKITARKITPPPFIDKENIFKKNKDIVSGKPTFTKPTLTKSDIIFVKKTITLPPIDMDKINNPSYISYYQIVREKIRRAAYQNYTSTESGEAYLSFIISNNGYLKELRLVEEKSSSIPYLKEISLRSIKEASPFPSFPKDLDYPQLSFNVIISFEIE